MEYTRMRSCLSVLCCVMSAWMVSGAQASDMAAPKGVVELFTSQGCASCPPADAAFAKLAQQGDVVALAYHVDYWNYLGWVDTLGSKENTSRQYAYAKMLGRHGVYTPQAILNGREHTNGADFNGINTRLKQLQSTAKGLTTPVHAAVNGEEITIDVGGVPGQTGKANVVVVYFTRQQKVALEKGENTGQTVDYWHAVNTIQTVGMWDGMTKRYVIPATVLKSQKNDGAAVLLQRVKNGNVPAAILGATVIMAPQP